jgi:hypothetical protein
LYIDKSKYPNYSGENMPSSSTIVVRQLIIQAIYLLSQFAIYRLLRSQFGDTPLRRTIILAAMVAINLPWLFVAVRMMLYQQPPRSYTLLATVFGWFMISAIFLLYFGIVRSGYAFWEMLKPASATATAALTRRAFLQKAAMGFGAVALVASARGLWLARGTPRIERVTLHLLNLPAAFDGMRLVQLSDFHSGPYMSREQMLSVRRQAEALKPDLYFSLAISSMRLPSRCRPSLRRLRIYARHLGCLQCWAIMTILPTFKPWRPDLRRPICPCCAMRIICLNIAARDWPSSAWMICGRAGGLAAGRILPPP